MIEEQPLQPLERLFFLRDSITLRRGEYSWGKGGMDMRVRMGRGGAPSAKKSQKERGRAGGRQLLQLVACVVLFLTVFIGKGVLPEEMAQVGPQLLGVLRANTDFRGAFAALGSTMAEGEPVLDGFIFLHRGRVVRSGSADEARAESGKSLDELFREVFRCLPNY